jgi:hypothetical protein
VRLARLFPLVVFFCAARAQEPVSGNACANAEALLPNPRDARGLEAYVDPIHPQLGYAFRFQAGYRVQLPLNQLAGGTNLIRVLTRVAAADGSGGPVCLLQTASLPEVPAGLKESLWMSGGFFLGEGRYLVDVTVTDRSERAYRKRVILNAALGRRERRVKLEVGPGVVQPFGLLAWEPRHATETTRRSRMTVLFNAASLTGSRIHLNVFNQVLLLSSLSTVLAECGFDDIRLVAFNLDQQRELFRQDHLDATGFRKLLQTVLSLNLSVVPITALKPEAERFDMLESLMRTELSSQEPADAILFLGPYQRDEFRWRSLPCESGSSGPPLFYFQHRVNWAYQTWRTGSGPVYESPVPVRPLEIPDTLERLVHACSGEVLRVHDPGELAAAILKFKDRTGRARTAHVQ